MLSRFSHVRFFATPWTVAHQALLSMGFSRQEFTAGWVQAGGHSGLSQTSQRLRLCECRLVVGLVCRRPLRGCLLGECGLVGTLLHSLHGAVKRHCVAAPTRGPLSHSCCLQARSREGQSQWEAAFWLHLTSQELVFQPKQVIQGFLC